VQVSQWQSKEGNVRVYSHFMHLRTQTFIRSIIPTLNWELSSTGGFFYDFPEHGRYRIETTHPLTHLGTSEMLVDMINVIFILTVWLVEPKTDGGACSIKHSYVYNKFFSIIPKRNKAMIRSNNDCLLLQRVNFVIFYILCTENVNLTMKRLHAFSEFKWNAL
jgi:hypothetical protein